MTFPTIWSERVRKLIWATGENESQIAVRFGFETREIERILKGRRPMAAFVIRLQSLEANFAAELEALKDGRIELKRSHHKGVGWKRIDHRDTGSHQRPGDLEALGAVGLARKSVSGPPPKALRVAPDYGTKAFGYRPHGSGRSAPRTGESGDIGQGVSGC